MVRARTAKGQQVRPWLGNAQGGFPKRDTRNAVVPFLAHKVQPVGRICHNAVDAVLFQRWQYLQTVAA